jgi:predicted metal-binding membrane protein
MTAGADLLTTDLVADSPRSDPGELAAAFAAVRSRLGVAAVLLAIAGIAWWASAVRKAGIDAGPGTSLGALGWFASVWAVMMGAMMLPSLAPTAAVYATLARRPAPSRWLSFVGGYLLAWSAAGVAAYGLFEVGKSLFGSALAWHSGGRWLAAAVLMLGALYQLTPLKHACLERCRSPVRFLHAGWREGPSGGLAMGVRNGLWCLGFSWALMTALFALGVMSLTWMAFVAGLVAVEKLGPWRRATTAATAGVLTVLAVAILAAPQDVPGLVIPGSAAAMHAMTAMQ